MFTVGIRVLFGSGSFGGEPSGEGDDESELGFAHY
jgi:hypothetical protein